MSKNNNLHSAKKAKNDELQTQIAELRQMVMEMKKHAADFICKKYNWDEVVKETMKLYRRKQ